MPLPGRLALAALAGVIATAGFAPFGLWPLTVLAVVALLVLVADRGVAQTALLAFVFGWAHFVSGIYWVYLSTVYYGNAAPWLGVLLVMLLAAVLALYVTGALALSRWLAPSQATSPLVVGVLWTFFELIRGTWLEGFPWLATGYAFIDTGLRDLAPVVGVHGISGLIWGLAALCVVAWRVGARRARFAAGAAVATLVIVAWLLPRPSHWTQPDGGPLSVALLQGNVAQADKWVDAQAPRIAGLYQDMTDAVLGTDLIVWPEVAVPYTYPQIRDGYLARIGRKARDAGSAVVLGTLVPNDDRTQMRNAVVGIGTTSGTYLKRHLVPFGEVFPLPDWLRPILDVMDLRFANLDTGRAGQPHFLVGDTPLSISICFEDVFGDEIAFEARGAGVLVNVTNDSWFHDATAAPQHLEIARMRAAETGRPLLKAAQTGITAHIDADGRIADVVPQFEVATLRTEVTPVIGSTPYMRWLDAPLWVAGVLTLLGLMGWRLMQRVRGPA